VIHFVCNGLALCRVNGVSWSGRSEIRYSAYSAVLRCNDGLLTY